MRRLINLRSAVQSSAYDIIVRTALRLVPRGARVTNTRSTCSAPPRPSAPRQRASRQTPHGKTSYSTVQCPHSTNLDIRRKIIDRYAQACGRKNVFLSLHGIVDGWLDGSSSCRRGDFEFFGPFLGRDRGRGSGSWLGGRGNLETGDDLFNFGEQKTRKGKWRTALLGYVWLCFM